MNNFQILPLTGPEDLPACAEVLVAAYNAPPWNDKWQHGTALAKLDCFYRSPKFFGWKAIDAQGQVIGACIGNVEPYFTGDYFYLKEMFVRPKNQAQGIGKAFMEILHAHLRSIGVGSIVLFTGRNYFPFHFYQKSGFEEMDDMRMMFWGTEA